jgi:hypothetical protein
MTHFATRRPRRLILLTLFLSLFQFGTALQALQIPANLAASLSLPLPLEFVTSGFWTLLFALFTLKLIRLETDAQHHTTLAIIGFIIYSVVRVALFAQADYDRQRLPFLFTINAFILLIMAACLLRRSTNGDDQ